MMTKPTHVVLLHAYSSHNSGDGLLVDLSVDLLKGAFGNATSVSIIAADPGSFARYTQVYSAPVLASSGFSRLAGVASALLPVERNGRLCELSSHIAKADIVVGVGGGYLRARNWTEALKLEAGHLLQMRAACRSGKPVVYLPQSIGPVMAAAPVRSHLTRMLGEFSSVFVRDDRSAAFLVRNPNTYRAPDLAVLDFERRSAQIIAHAQQGDLSVRHVAFVLRKAPSWTALQRQRYEAATRKLVHGLARSCRITFAVQSMGRGNDDLAYYRSIDIHGDLVPLKELLKTDRPDVVVSVRLHGSLESILSGVPSYHLSYERKGFGAYADLGLDNWVANAADFDPDEVIARILAPDAIRDFWTNTSLALARISASRDTIVDALRNARGA
jgi:polysaccharide pyruvyl transferase WcaK-like protein